MVDSDHGHDLITGKSATEAISFLGSTPIRWFAKRQSTARTAAFGSELIALKRGTEEGIAHGYYLRSLGAKVQLPTAACLDNMPIIKNSANPSSSLQKKHAALASHFCREKMLQE